MLKNLHIENIAVIERADVEFSSGLSVLTGETGAGKSIIIDALNAALGSRISRDLVRTGSERASVTAVFENALAAAWCRDNELDADGDEIVLQRRLSPDGKSSARVNGLPVSAAQLRELGARLLDIHGQNDGRQLPDEKRHLSYLDQYAAEMEAKQAFSVCYDRYRQLKKEADSLRLDEAEKLQLEDTLRFRIAELEKAEIRPGEEEELSARRDLLRNAEKLTEFLDAAYAALYDRDDSAVSLCGEAEYAVGRSAAWSPELQEAEELIRSARLSLEDAAERVREKQAELDFSPDEYDRLENRLNLLRRLEKKYAADEAGLVRLLEESRERLDRLEYSGERLAKLDREIDAALAAAKKAAADLTEKRKAAAARLEKQVEAELKALNMPSVRFRVKLDPRSGEIGMDATGADEIRFLMSANAGEALGPIDRIASGGELSRLMLALKNVFAERDLVDALVFDEIDTGVSGIAAQRVAEKLAQLAKNKQVLCVTHLPQIAAMADEQFLVEKEEHGGRTFTEIRLLDREGRKRELARLTSGGELTETQLAGAEELLTADERFRSAL